MKKSKFLEEYNRLVNYKNLYEQTRAAAVAPDKLVIPDVPASSGYILNNFPIVLEKVYSYLSSDAKQEILGLIVEAEKLSADLEKLAGIYDNVARSLEWHNPTIESLEISHIYRFAKDLANFLAALGKSQYKFISSVK